MENSIEHFKMGIEGLKSYVEKTKESMKEKSPEDHERFCEAIKKAELNNKIESLQGELSKLKKVI